jgi:hypothetical protein
MGKALHSRVVLFEPSAALGMRKNGNETSHLDAEKAIFQACGRDVMWKLDEDIAGIG